jgi:hypothetical protein
MRFGQERSESRSSTLLMLSHRIPWGVFATMAPAYASEVCPTALRGYLTVYGKLPRYFYTQETY